MRKYKSKTKMYHNNLMDEKEEDDFLISLDNFVEHVNEGTKNKYKILFIGVEKIAKKMPTMR
jgi:hypothetical protein